MKVCVLGSRSFIGKNLLEGTRWSSTNSDTLDLCDRVEVDRYFLDNTYDVVIHCGVVGGSRLSKDDGNVAYKNILMFENVVRHIGKSFSKLIYFSSGASISNPTEPYGLSKWVIDQRIKHIPGSYSLRIWGCYGPGELSTRFSAVCKDKGHVVIQKDRYFDFIDVMDVKKIVNEYIDGVREQKEYNLVYGEKLLLSQWAEKFGATYDIKDKDGLDSSYVC
jgi:nucleoside-diphosphate-sugar epimerase